MKIPLTLSAPHTLRLKSDAAGEFLMAGHDEGFVGGAREVHPSHHAAAGDAGFAAFVAHLPSVEIFVGPLPASALPFLHTTSAVTHAFAPMPVAHASGFAGSPLAAAPPPPSLPQAQVDALETGWMQTLSGIESNLIAQVFAQNLPVLGDNLAPLGRGTDRRNLHLLTLPADPSQTPQEHQPARTLPPGTQTPLPRRAHLPQRRELPAPHPRPRRRAARGMARWRPLS